MEKMHQKFPSMLGRKSLFVSPRKLIKDINMPSTPRLQTERFGLPKTTINDILSTPKCIINDMKILDHKKSGEVIFGLQLISLAYNHDPITGKLDFNSPARDKQGNVGVMVYQLSIVFNPLLPAETKASLHMLYEDSIYVDNPHKYAFLSRLEQTSTHTADKRPVLDVPHMHIPSPKQIIISSGETALTGIYHCTPEIYSSVNKLTFEQIINGFYDEFNIQNDLNSAIPLQTTIPTFTHSQDGKFWLDTVYKPVVMDNIARENILKNISSAKSGISKVIEQKI